MRSRWSRRAAAALAVALLSPAAWADKTALKAEYKEGDRHTVSHEQSMEMNGTTPMGAMAVKARVRKAFTQQVVAAEDGKPKRVSRTYAAYEETNDVTMGGAPAQTNTESKPFVGKTITLVEENGKGKVHEPAPETAGMDDEDLRLGSEWDLVLPAGEVESGESWTLTEAQVKEFLSEENMSGATVRCTFEGVTDYGGQKAGRILVEIAATMKQEAAGQTLTLKVAGPVHWSVDAKRLIAAQLEGTVDATMAGVTMSGPVKMSTRVEAAPAEGAK
ncbi:MAG: hypothetical protein ACREID_04230 [Planctomycetota bacterium]